MHEGRVHDSRFLQPPPRPFAYAVSAGRHAGGKPDRYFVQQGDEYGVVQGSYSYLAPNWKWQKVGKVATNTFHEHTTTHISLLQVEYVADADGFHVLPGSTPLSAAQPEETPVVAALRAKHEELYRQIADRNNQVLVVDAEKEIK